MERKTAVAAATAISMTLASAAIAIGANFGALGFAQSSSATPAQPSAVSAAAPASSTASITSSTRSGAHERDGSEHQTTGTSQGGHSSDD